MITRHSVISLKGLFYRTIITKYILFVKLITGDIQVIPSPGLVPFSVAPQNKLLPEGNRWLK